MKKYCFTDEKIEVDGHTLHRIKALVTIQEFAVKTGQLGGWIESEDNLSHVGKAWVDEEGKVYGDARIHGFGLNPYQTLTIYGDSCLSDGTCIGL